MGRVRNAETSEQLSATVLISRPRIILEFPKQGMDQCLELTHPQTRSKTPPRPLREAFRFRMGRTRAEAQRRRGGNWEGEECRNVGAAFCNCLDQ